jgi:ribose 5-phosphate isomerase RpiB
VADSSSKPRIALGADHAGFRAKENIKKYLEGAGCAVDDVATWLKESGARAQFLLAFWGRG